jgi:hypothetical protein
MYVIVSLTIELDATAGLAHLDGQLSGLARARLSRGQWPGGAGCRGRDQCPHEKTGHALEAGERQGSRGTTSLTIPHPQPRIAHLP